MYCANGILEKLKPMFEYTEDTVVKSFFDGIFGNAYCDNLDCPSSAVIAAGDFFFVAGNPAFSSEVMKLAKDKKMATFIPDSADWFEPLNSQGKKLLFLERYKTKLPKDGFDIDNLEKIKSKISLHNNLKLEPINEKYYHKALEEEWSKDFVGNFKDYDDFSSHGFGYVITKNEEIIAGTSTFSYHKDGVEIEVSTREDYRGRGLAQISSAAFMLECLKRSLVPSWDARNKASLAISKHMGFEYTGKYIAFEFDNN